METESLTGVSPASFLIKAAKHTHSYIYVLSFVCVTEIVTEDATAAAGSAPECASNIRLAWDRIYASASTGVTGLAALTNAFQLCSPLTNGDEVDHLVDFLAFAWDTLAMGNFPYPSNYLVFQQTQDPNLELPAFPIRAACEKMRGDFNENTSDATVFSSLREATGVLYNVSGKETCFDIPQDTEFDGIWDYQHEKFIHSPHTLYPYPNPLTIGWSYNFSGTAQSSCRKRHTLEETE